MTYKWNLPARKILRPPDGWSPTSNLPELHGIVALDTETDDPGLAAHKGSSWCRKGEGSVCGFSIAWREHDTDVGFYVPINHAAGNVDAEKAFNWLRAQGAKDDVHFVYANAIYDLGWLQQRHDFNPVNLPCDVQGMAALLDERRSSYSLDSLAWAYLKKRKNTQALREESKKLGYLDPYKAMRKLPAWSVEEYATDDALDTLDLYYEMLPLIKAQDLTNVLEIEKECLLIGRDLRAHGVRVDLDEAARVKKQFLDEREAAVRRVYDATGVHVDPDDKQSIKRALEAENPTLQFTKTAKGQVSIRAGWIDSLHSPVGKDIGLMRRLTKAVQTFIEGYIEGHTGADGRIHADFNPLRRNSDDDDSLYGVAGGRWSSTNPNLQNIPRRDPHIGPAIRTCFKPEEGELWGKLDYSSQEPRLTTHFAYKLWLVRDKLGPDWSDRFQGVDDMVQAYRETPGLSMHKVVAKGLGIDISADKRAYDNVKVLNLGIIYGMGGKKFCQSVGLPTKFITTEWGKTIEVAGDEGQRLLDKHFERFPWIKDVADFATSWAEGSGYMKTISGRRIRFEERDAKGRALYTYKALNASVQGSAADQMKLAQIQFRRAGFPALVYVHDDANLSIPRGEAGRKMMKDAAEIMAQAVTLEVPSIAEGRVGKNWGSVGRDRKGLL